MQGVCNPRCRRSPTAAAGNRGRRETGTARPSVFVSHCNPIAAILSKRAVFTPRRRPRSRAEHVFAWKDARVVSTCQSMAEDQEPDRQDTALEHSSSYQQNANEETRGNRELYRFATRRPAEVGWQVTGRHVPWQGAPAGLCHRWRRAGRTRKSMPSGDPPQTCESRTGGLACPCSAGWTAATPT